MTQTIDIAFTATSNEWDAPVTIYWDNGKPVRLTRDVPDPETGGVNTFLPHAVVHVDGVLTVFDAKRQPTVASTVSGPWTNR